MLLFGGRHQVHRLEARFPVGVNHTVGVVGPEGVGPEGVAAPERGGGIGSALLLCALHAQRAQGYAYATIGGVGPAQFYAKAVGAISIPGSTPGVYAGLLKR